MSPLQLYDTRMRAKADVRSADPSGHDGLFVCGPTVYDLPHLGHAKTYTQFDFLVRLRRARGFAVTYVQNITPAAWFRGCLRPIAAAITTSCCGSRAIRRR